MFVNTVNIVNSKKYISYFIFSFILLKKKNMKLLFIILNINMIYE